MVGVVLSGGESRRMGSDKGLLLSESRNWVQIAYDKLTNLLSNVLVSVNPSQVDSYNGYFDARQLVADNETLNVKGPLHGILSVHVHYPEKDLFVLACDMVAMNDEPLEKLYRSLHDNPGKDCYLFSDQHGYQPLAGIYTAALLSRLLEQVKKGTLEKFSMMHVLETADTHLLPVPPGWEHYFVNYNFKEDIDFQ